MSESRAEGERVRGAADRIASWLDLWPGRGRDSERVYSLGVDGGDPQDLLISDLRAVADEVRHRAYLDEGWWHPNVKSGQVHDHSAKQPQTMHRLCVPVYTRRTVSRPEDEVHSDG